LSSGKSWKSAAAHASNWRRASAVRPSSACVRHHYPGPRPEPVIAHKLDERLLHLGGSALLTAQCVLLEPADTQGVNTLRPAAMVVGLRDEPFGLGEAPLEQREECDHGRHVPALRRLVKRFSGACVRGELVLHGREVSGLHQHRQAVMMALERALVVADPFSQGDDLVGDGEPLLGRVGAPDRRVPAIECVRERGVIAESSSHVDRLRTQRCPLLTSRLVPQRAGESGHQPGPQGAGLITLTLKSVLQEGHDVAIVGGPPPHEPAAIAEGGAGEQFGGADASGRVGCGQEGVATGLGITGAHRRVAE
jgi:hypothetical protein